MRSGGFLILALVACTSANPLDDLTVVKEDPSDSSLRGLDADWQSRFDAGDALFEQTYRATQGLGPAYVRSACADCHANDSKGPGSVRKMVVVEEDGTTAPDQTLLPYGFSERPQLSAGAQQPIKAPQDPRIKRSVRIGPAVFGRGFLEAIKDSEIERVAAEQALRADGISGRINRVAYQSEPNPNDFHAHAPGAVGLIGRFGLKARMASIDELAADAFLNDMGITSPMRPHELPNPDGLTDDDYAGVDITLDVVNTVSDYVRLLAIPKRTARDNAIFATVGCASCHVASMHTREDYPVPALRDVDAPVYSDLLLHDMGDDLADGLREGEATGREWRTAPLIGMRHLQSYLHDGRAKSIEEAILAHRSSGSEANGVIDAYSALSDADRQSLHTFIEGL